MKFSIVIPAYNAEKYIHHCLDSVVNQDFPADQYEVIVVDDCSPDYQNVIIERYAGECPFCYSCESQVNNIKGDVLRNELPNVRLIKHELNKRQGGARNTGIAAAKGEWILFIDSDDYWCSYDVLKTFDRLINTYPESDIVEARKYQTSSEYTSNNRVSGPSVEQANVRRVSPSEYYSNNPHPCIVTAAFRKGLVSDIKFRENVFYEDTDWKIKAYTTARKIVTFDFPFYVYFQNTNSTTTSKSVNAFEDAILANVICRQSWQASGLPADQINRILSNGKKDYLRSILGIRNYPFADGKRLLRILKNSGSRNDFLGGMNLAERFLSGTSELFPWLTTCIIHAATAFKRLLCKLKH